MPIFQSARKSQIQGATFVEVHGDYTQNVYQYPPASPDTFNVGNSSFATSTLNESEEEGIAGVFECSSKSSTMEVAL